MTGYTLIATIREPNSITTEPHRFGPFDTRPAADHCIAVLAARGDVIAVHVEKAREE